MPAVSLSRILIFAEHEQAEQLVKLLTAITGAEAPAWSNHVRRDGSYSHGTSIDVGGVTVEVRVGRPAVPALLELATDRPLDQIVDQVVDTLGCCTSWPNHPDLPAEHVTAYIGESISVRFVPALAAATEAVTA